MSTWKRLGPGAVFGLVALGMAPLTAVYFQNLWLQKHYQFFPVLIGAVALLLVSRWKAENDRKVDNESEGAGGETLPTQDVTFWMRVRPLFALALVAVGVAIEFAAVWLFSPITPWGGYLGFLVAGFGVVLYVSTGRAIPLWPVWALMAMILMPPGDADDKLITFLQQRTASFTSRLLDFLNVDHVQEGVLIEISSKKMFVEEACSGVQSLFSLLAVAAVLAVWHARSLVHASLLFVSAVAGAGAINVLRTVAIVYGLDKVGIDLLAEPQHSILGVAVFAIALAWLACCDGFLTFLLDPVDSADLQVEKNFWVVAWNRLMGGLKPWPATGQIDPGVTIRWLSRAGLAAIALSSGVLAVASTRAVLDSQQPGSNPLLAPVAEGEVLGKFASLTEDSLPAEFDGWKRLKFEPVERSESNDFGQHSKTWVYRTPFGLATCSVDYPFRGWHDLQVCYQGGGWTASDAKTSSSAGGHGIADVTQFSLQKRSGDRAMVLFAAMNERLEPVASRELGGVAQDLIKRIQQTISATDNTDVIAQFQILVQPQRTLTDADVADVQAHLNLLRARMIAHLQNPGAAAP